MVDAGSLARSHPTSPAVPGAGPAAPPDSTPAGEFTVIDAKTADVSNLATRMVKFLTPRPSILSKTKIIGFQLHDPCVGQLAVSC